jgi:hemolysin III
MTLDDLNKGARDAATSAREAAAAARVSAVSARDAAADRARDAAAAAGDRARDAASAARDAAAAVAVKPRLRGHVHQWAFFVSLALGVGLVTLASGERARVAVLIYAISLSGLLGTSALYHRVTWSERARFRMRQLDHSMIFVLIAGTVTPIALLAVKGSLATILLCVVWGGAIAGIILNLLWTDHPKWVSSVIYSAVGLSGAIAIGSLLGSVGVLAVVGIAVGGVLYLIGAVIYAVQRPNPVPTVFGYHEVFHVLVVVAAAVHFGVIAAIILPHAAG